VPQQVRVIQHQSIKYACPCCDLGIEVTPAPARIVPKGLLTESALAWWVVSTIADALPVYRIAALPHRFKIRRADSKVPCVPSASCVLQAKN
jgi:transposase